MPRCFGASASVREQEDPVRLDGSRRPDLLPVDDPVVAVEHGTRRDVREVRAGVGFGEPLAPPVLTREDSGQEVPLLLLGAPPQDRVPQHLETHDVVVAHRRHAGTGQLLDEHDLLELREPRAAVLLRPLHAEEAVLASVARHVSTKRSASARSATAPRPCHPGGSSRARKSRTRRRKSSALAG